MAVHNIQGSSRSAYGHNACNSRDKATVHSIQYNEPMAVHSIYNVNRARIMIYVSQVILRATSVYEQVKFNLVGQIYHIFSIREANNNL